MIQTQWHNWLTEKALPLWGQQGFDESARLYYERLTFQAMPLHVPHRRLMVQARQIASFCQAQLNGHYQGGDRALETLARVETLYHQADDMPGWAFALGPDLTPSDTKRDLYGHAFILFAYGWAYRLSPSPHYLDIALQTLQDIDAIFASEHGGYKDVVPVSSPRHSQNPHMHLLEACLTLFEVSSNEVFLSYADTILDLALTHFIPKGTNALLEFFTPHWQPEHPTGMNRVEPGHQAEWCWLLGEYLRLAPTGQHALRAKEIQKRLFDHLQHAVISPLLPDALLDSDRLLEDSTRIWPQTEMMRLLAQHAPAPRALCTERLTNMSAIFFTHYAPPALAGGWVDRLDAQNAPLTDHMPASSLYHIYSAGQAIIRM